jgi:signal transduction histidine kinase
MSATRIPSRMSLSRRPRPWGRRVLVLVGLGVGIPAALLVTLGIFLTLRIARAIENESARYNLYMALQVGDAFEQELMDELRLAVASAENVARAGAQPPEVLATLRASAAGNRDFVAPHFVPTEELTGYSVLTVEAQLMIYAPNSDSSRFFAGLLLRDPQGQVIGAGGYWHDPERYLHEHLQSVVQERLPSNQRLYGGIESTRRLSVQILGPTFAELARVRDPGPGSTSRMVPLSGPFERFLVRVTPTRSAPIALAARFVTVEVTFIALMGLAIVLATLFGLRVILRQVELAQMKAGFVSNVTHELKTPIALIRLSVETLELGRVRGPEDTAQFLGTISRETHRLEQLVNNILDFARLEAGKQIFKFEAVDAGRVVRNTLEAFSPRLEHQNFQVQVDLPEALPRVRADATALSHSLLNLLDNAVKYSKERREIRVTAGTRDHAVWIAVKDRGIGIAAEDRARVFEKFVRLDTGLVHEVKGAGLGLTLVDQIMRAHGGRVEVESTPGEGSEFRLVVPIAEGAEPSGADHPARTGT